MSAEPPAPVARPAAAPTAVTLVVPPDPTMARVARLTASALAAGAGMTVDVVDDVKIAVSEMIALFVGRGSPDPVTLVFEPSEGTMRIEASSPAPPFAADDPELELTHLVLDAVTESHGMSHDGSTLRLTALLGPQSG